MNYERSGQVRSSHLIDIREHVGEAGGEAETYLSVREAVQPGVSDSVRLT